MLQRMHLSMPSPRMESRDVITESAFISNAFAQAEGRTSSTTATEGANLTMKLLQMKRDKDREMAAKRDAALEAMNESIERRAQEAEAKRQEIHQKKLEKQASRRAAAAEKRKLQAAEKQAALEVVKQQKREEADARKAYCQQQKEMKALEAAAKKAELGAKRAEQAAAKREEARKRELQNAARREEQSILKAVQVANKKALKAAREGPSGEGDEPVAKKHKKVSMFDELR